MVSIMFHVHPEFTFPKKTVSKSETSLQQRAVSNPSFVSQGSNPGHVALAQLEDEGCIVPRRHRFMWSQDSVPHSKINGMLEYKNDPQIFPQKNLGSQKVKL